MCVEEGGGEGCTARRHVQGAGGADPDDDVSGLV